MAGNRNGALITRDKNLKKDPDFYRKIGAKGGKVKGVKKGFALDPERARRAGAKGGKISKRGKAKHED